MTTFNWSIQSLLVMQTPEPGTVVLSRYTLTGVDGAFSASASGTVELLPADPSNFTPYDQITEAQAIQWTQAALGPIQIASAQQYVQGLIDDQKIPQPQAAPLPWSS